jgi:protein-disulfide isomerase
MITSIPLKIPISGSDHSHGEKGASLTLLQYGDFQCSYCRLAFDAVKRIQAEFGKGLRFIHRHFPNSEVHPDAWNAARAAEAAALQGKFWEMYDLLYLNQEKLDLESLRAYARQLGLEGGVFERDMNSPEVEARIEDDFQGAVASKVSTTPSFFINGLRYEGYWSYEALVKDLQAAQAQTGS